MGFESHPRWANFLETQVRTDIHQAGKHILLEKPFTSNAAEAEALVKEADQANKILMEAFHWQFHPAAHLFRSILESGDYGNIISTNAKMTASPGVPDGDIRWQFDLAGGSLMDATYALSFTRYAPRAGVPDEILSAVARPYSQDERVDAAMTATMLFKDPQGRSVHSRVYTDIARSWVGGVVPRIWELPQIEVETEKAVILFYNAMMPHCKFPPALTRHQPLISYSVPLHLHYRQSHGQS
jgi:predicted dehydrogenase